MRSVKQLCKKYSGFTLVEVLVTVSVIGVVASAVIAIINPIEFIERGRDASRKAKINSIGKALDRYYTIHGSYPNPATVETDLLSTGELKEFPVNDADVTTPCDATFGQGAVLINGFCYNTSDAGDSVLGAVAYTAVTSGAEMVKCEDVAWFTWSALAQSSGIHCTESEEEEPPLDITDFPAEQQGPTSTPPPPGSPTSTPANTPTGAPINTPTDVPTSTPTDVPANTPTDSPNTPTPGQVIVNLLPTADIYVNANTPDTNLNGDLQLGMDSGPHQIAYMKFDLSDPQLAGKTIQSAILRITILPSGNTTGTQNLRYTATDTWSETTMTYNNRPGLGTQFATMNTANGTGLFDQNVTTGAQGRQGGIFAFGLEQASNDGFFIYPKESTTGKPILVITAQ